ncbi:MAG TPA: TIGR03435 family protein [Bryobacteraceae bacterium]
MTVAQMSYPYFAASAVLLLSGLAVKAQAPAAQLQSARPEFEVASVKPNTAGNNMIMIRPPTGGRFTATNATLKILAGLAYKVQNYAITGGPNWIDSAHFDITAKAADSNLSIEQMRPMLQSLLQDRFQLKAHLETKDVPVYALLPAKNGPKLPEGKEGGCFQFDPGKPPPPPAPGQGPGAMQPPCGGMMMSPNAMHGGKVSMTQFIGALSNMLGRPVIDKTGFTGTFDVNLEYSAEGLALGGRGGPGPPPGAPAFDTSGPSIFTAVQEQLGLRLESQKAPGEILVIDSAEKPSEN